MRNITTFLAIVFLFSLNNLYSQNKKWTLLLYMIGTDIVDDAITDLGEIKAATSTDNINIIGMLGGSNRAGWTQPSVSRFESGSETSLTYTPHEAKMVSVSNLTQFIDWGVTNYPADKYMLAFYNHGMAIRGWGWDQTTDTQFSINDLKAGIGNSTFIQQGNKFEVLAFDACEMASLEAQSPLHNLAKYYVASEEEEPWHAWNWTPIINTMNSQNNLSGLDLGKVIVDNFIQHSLDNNSHAVTLSVIDLAKIPDLVGAMEQVIESLDDDIYLASLIRARAKSEEYAKKISNPKQSEDVADIGDLLKHLKNEEPGIAPLIDNALAKLNAAVLYQRSDAARPQAHGISMFVPLNLFSDGTTADFIVDTYYKPINFSDSIQNFISGRYLDFGFSDDAPIEATVTNSLGKALGSSGNTLFANQNYAAIKIEDHHLDELHQLQVILLEEIKSAPDEFIILGSTFPDTSITDPDGAKIYGYEWDEEWLSINGFPAYVADIQEFGVRDSMDNVTHTFTRLHIPAILNMGTADEKGIMLDYIYDENFNFVLEGIDRESYESGTGFVVTAKDRITLQPGDSVQLLYEVFDAQTHEATFVPEPNAVIAIQNGNSDLVLGHTRLEAGKYHVGFVVMDHSHNDTLIYDPNVWEVFTTGIDVLPAEAYNISIYPNPTADRIQVDFAKASDAKIQVLNNMGQIVKMTEVRNDNQTNINLKDLPTGVYFLKIMINGQVLQKEIIKR